MNIFGFVSFLISSFSAWLHTGFTSMCYTEAILDALQTGAAEAEAAIAAVLRFFGI